MRLAIKKGLLIDRWYWWLPTSTIENYSQVIIAISAIFINENDFLYAPNDFTHTFKRLGTKVR